MVSLQEKTKPAKTKHCYVVFKIMQLRASLPGLLTFLILLLMTMPSTASTSRVKCSGRDVHLKIS